MTLPTFPCSQHTLLDVLCMVSPMCLFSGATCFCCASVSAPTCHSLPTSMCCNPVCWHFVQILFHVLSVGLFPVCFGFHPFKILFHVVPDSLFSTSLVTASLLIPAASLCSLSDHHRSCVSTPVVCSCHLSLPDGVFWKWHNVSASRCLHLGPFPRVPLGNNTYVILRGSAYAAGLALDALPLVCLYRLHHVLGELQTCGVTCGAREREQ